MLAAVAVQAFYNTDNPVAINVTAVIGRKQPALKIS